MVVEINDGQQRFFVEQKVLDVLAFEFIHLLDAVLSVVLVQDYGLVEQAAAGSGRLVLGPVTKILLEDVVVKQHTRSLGFLVERVAAGGLPSYLDDLAG